MGWKTVSHMFGPSPVCTGCGQSPRDEEGPLPAYNSEGVDVDWGNHLFICHSCAGIIGELHGMITEDVKVRLERKIRLQAEELEAANTKLAKQQEQIDKIVGGVKARKELKSA